MATRLTKAAKRDLQLLADGKTPDLRYGPMTQLLDAGYITVTDGWPYTATITEAGQEAAGHE